MFCTFVGSITRLSDYLRNKWTFVWRTIDTESYKWTFVWRTIDTESYKYVENYRY